MIIVRRYLQGDKTIDYLFIVADIKTHYYYIAAIIMVVTFICAGRLSLMRRIALSLLLPYIFLVFASTVLDRSRDEEAKGVFRLFRDYEEIRKGTELGEYLKKELTLNILMLVPIGVLVPIIARRKKIIKTVLTALTLSTAIEVTQLATKRGYFEFDDIFHNTVGALIAAIVTILIMSAFSVMKKE